MEPVKLRQIGAVVSSFFFAGRQLPVPPSAVPFKFDDFARLRGRTAAFLASIDRVGVGWFELLLPPQCASCDATVQHQGELCAACFARTDFITEPFCSRCGVPFGAANHPANLLCYSCQEAPPLFGQARAALRYNMQGRRLILPFKHGNRTDLSTALTLHMVRAGAELLRRADLLVAVPLHRCRLFRRRYNQAVLMAVELSHLTGIPVLRDGLVRRRRTPSLGDKSASERADTVRDAFVVRSSRKPYLQGKNVLLIDDVMTSGATANACATALLSGGVERVDVLVAARVPDPRLG